MKALLHQCFEVYNFELADVFLINTSTAVLIASLLLLITTEGAKSSLG